MGLEFYVSEGEKNKKKIQHVVWETVWKEPGGKQIAETQSILQNSH